MNRVKVLHYIPGFNIGGIESRLLDWYENIDHDKVEFVVVKLNTNNDSDKLIQFVELGGRYHNLPAFKPQKFIQYIVNLKRIFKEEMPDVVHVHSLSTGIFPLYFAKKYNVPVRILHSRTTGYLPNEKNILLKKIFKKFTAMFATDYFACSYEAGIWGCGEKNKDKIRVIKNGIDLQRFEFDERIRTELREKLGLQDKLIIGTIGRLSPQKNLSFLLDVFSIAVKQNPNLVLLIVGEGTLRKEMEVVAEELGILEAVRFLGAHSDVWNYYMAFDIFIGTSFYEGFGTTAIEAQATGVPTILSEGFPGSVVLTDYVKRISLSESREEWASEIVNTKLRRRSKEDIVAIDIAGYSAQRVSKELQEFYCSRN